MKSRISLAAALVALLLGIDAAAAMPAAEHNALLQVHPQTSTADEPASDHVEWIWSGGLSASTITIRARMHYETDQLRIIVSSSRGSGVRHRSGRLTADDADDRVISATFDALTADTDYVYAVEVDGKLDRDSQGHFRTPGYGAFSFQFAVSACANWGSNAAIFDTIRAQQPLFFINTGDFFYGDIEENDIEPFQEAYEDALTSPGQAALYRSLPFDYVWDDHDSAGNNANRESNSMPAALAAYQQNVPHYQLPLVEEGAIGHAYTIGRVRFIVTDVRGDRDPQDDPDGPEKSILGEAQKQWFKDELLAARDRYALIVWVSSVPWIAEADEGADNWGGYADERRELAQFIADNDIDDLLMLAGDAHMIAIDDGSNSNYAESGGPGFPVFHSGPLEQPGRIKGGPYSEGALPGTGQFGLVTIDDDGATVTVTLSGRDTDNQELMRYQFTAQPEYLSVPPFPADGLFSEPY